MRRPPAITGVEHSIPVATTKPSSTSSAGGSKIGSMVRIMPSDDRGDSPFAQFETDVVIKDDGRSLIYYSWPDAPDEDDAPESAPPPPPDPEPWSPQSGPADV